MLLVSLNPIRLICDLSDKVDQINVQINAQLSRTMGQTVFSNYFSCDLAKQRREQEEIVLQTSINYNVRARYN